MEAAAFNNSTIGELVDRGGCTGTDSVITPTPTSGRSGGRFTEAILLERKMRGVLQQQIEIR